MTTDCPQKDLHYSGADEPSLYVAWHQWAEEKTKTHTQSRCPTCRLYKIWTPKSTNQPAPF